METEERIIYYRIDINKIKSYNDVVDDIESSHKYLHNNKYVIYYINNEKRKLFINWKEDFEGAQDFCSQNGTSVLDVKIKYSKTEDLKIFDCPPTPAKATSSKATPAKVSPSKSFHSEDEAIEDESGEISDWDENSDIDYSIKVYASLQKQSSSNKEGEDSIAHELGYCIVDMAKFLKITSTNSENEREHIFRDYEKADYKDDETEEYKGEILARGKSIIIETSYNSSDDRPSIARESNVFSISSSEVEEVKKMEFEHNDSNSKGTAKISGTFGEIRNSTSVKLDKNSTDKEKQIGKMVVVSGRYTQSQSDSTIVGIPGCSVMKTWRVRNDSNYSWPKDVYLKCLNEGVSWSLPPLKRHLHSREETDISVKINIPEDAENNKVINYAFAVCSREYSNMGDKLIATVQISKELFEKKALELKQNQTRYIEVDTKKFNSMFKNIYKRTHSGVV